MEARSNKLGSLNFVETVTEKIKIKSFIREEGKLTNRSEIFPFDENENKRYFIWDEDIKTKQWDQIL